MRRTALTLATVVVAGAAPANANAGTWAKSEPLGATVTADECRPAVALTVKLAEGSRLLGEAQLRKRFAKKVSRTVVAKRCSEALAAGFTFRGPDGQVGQRIVTREHRDWAGQAGAELSVDLQSGVTVEMVRRDGVRPSSAGATILSVPLNKTTFSLADVHSAHEKLGTTESKSGLSRTRFGYRIRAYLRPAETGAHRFRVAVSRGGTEHGEEQDVSYDENFKCMVRAWIAGQRLGSEYGPLGSERDATTVVGPVLVKGLARKRYETRVWVACDAPLLDSKRPNPTIAIRAVHDGTGQKAELLRVPSPSRDATGVSLADKPDGLKKYKRGLRIWTGGGKRVADRAAGRVERRDIGWIEDRIGRGDSQTTGTRLRGPEGNPFIMFAKGVVRVDDPGRHTLLARLDIPHGGLDRDDLRYSRCRVLLQTAGTTDDTSVLAFAQGEPPRYEDVKEWRNYNVKRKNLAYSLGDDYSARDALAVTTFQASEPGLYRVKAAYACTQKNPDKHRLKAPGAVTLLHAHGGQLKEAALYYKAPRQDGGGEDVADLGDMDLSDASDGDGGEPGGSDGQRGNTAASLDSVTTRDFDGNAVATVNLRVRAEPTTAARKVAQIKTGSVVAVRGITKSKHTGHYWAKLPNGWVATTYLDLAGSEKSLESVDARTRYTVADTRVWGAPNPKQDAQTTLPKGSEVTVVKQGETWAKLARGGYVRRAALTAEKPATESVPIE